MNVAPGESSDHRGADTTAERANATRPDARPLSGARAAITRERPGRLADLLADAGATVVHVPLIEVVDAADGGLELADALSDLDDVDWVMVTSAAGAERVVGLAGDAIATGRLRIGVVGSATDATVRAATGRAADLRPERQTAADLAEAFVERHRGDPAQHVVVAQADRAAPDLVVGLRDAGHVVRTVTAYRTITRHPDPTERTRLLDTDLLLLASGSAAEGWVEAVGVDTARRAPHLVVAIGPTTAAVARRVGLKVDAVAADHSVHGLVQAAILTWRSAFRGDDGGEIVADSSAQTSDRRVPPAGG